MRRPRVLPPHRCVHAVRSGVARSRPPRRTSRGCRTRNGGDLCTGLCRRLYFVDAGSDRGLPREGRGGAPSAPKESPRGQLVRFLLASLVLALPLAAGSVIGLVFFFDRLSPPFGAVVEGLAAAGKSRWGRSCGARFGLGGGQRTSTRGGGPSPLVRYHLTPESGLLTQKTQRWAR